MNSRSAFVSLLVVVLLGAASLALLTPSATERLSEFYLLGADDQAGDYVQAVPVGQSVSIRAGIGNREGQAGTYRIEARLGGATVTRTDSLPLADNTDSEVSLTFSPTKPGDHQRVDVLLFYDDSPEPYRQLHFWIDVKEAG